MINPVHPICPICSVTNLDNRYASEEKAPSRLQPPSSRQVRNATSGAGSGPDGMGSSSGAVMVKPVPALRGGGGEKVARRPSTHDKRRGIKFHEDSHRDKKCG